MEEEARDTVGARDEATSTGVRTRRKRRSSRGGTASPQAESSSDNSEQESAQNNSASHGNTKAILMIDTVTTEGEKRNHFTRSRKPKSSTPRASKADAAKLVS